MNQVPEPKESPAENVVELQHWAARKGLGSRPRLRQFAVVLWASFIGAVLIQLTWLAQQPGPMTGRLELAELSLAFLRWWLVAAIPTWIGVVLSAAPETRSISGSPAHGQH